ncbi:hypothetical protein ACJMK2_027036 [Sinanodonta woodiana]|uniref:Uncharacterized protein n=1 Tax=Sinanodonta woodiana TaxID=1069815 RepID=A0ABD3XQ17_SINWO
MRKRHFVITTTILSWCHIMMIQANTNSDHDELDAVMPSRGIDFSKIKTLAQGHEERSNPEHSGINGDAIQNSLMPLRENRQIHADDILNILKEIEEKREPLENNMTRLSNVPATSTSKYDSESGGRYVTVTEEAIKPYISSNSTPSSLVDQKGKSNPKKQNPNSNIIPMADDEGGEEYANSEPLNAEIEEINEGIENPVPREKKTQSLRPRFNASDGERHHPRISDMSNKRDRSNLVFDTHPDKNHILPVKVILGFGSFIRGLLSF